MQRCQPVNRSRGDSYMVTTTVGHWTWWHIIETKTHQGNENYQTQQNIEFQHKTLFLVATISMCNKGICTKRLTIQRETTMHCFDRREIMMLIFTIESPTMSLCTFKTTQTITWLSWRRSSRPRSCVTWLSANGGQIRCDLFIDSRS